VTEESKALTTPWIEEHDVEFAYAYNRSGSVMAQIGTRGLPNAVLIDSYGTIVWKGHPSKLDDEIVQSALTGKPLTRALFELDGYTEDVRTALRARDYGAVYVGLEEVDDADDRHEVTQAIELIIDRRLARLDDLFEAGDYLAVKERATPLVKAFKGLPQQERVTALVKKLKDRQVTKVLRAQEKIRKLVPEGERIAEKDRPKIAKQLRKIVEDYPDTQAARDAEAVLEWLGG
jgi:hypothetical protein